MYEGESLTYAELNRRANQLAHYLREQGRRAGSAVAVCLERSFEMVVGLFGILKAGGAYVPLDPNYPAERLQHMLEDASAARCVLTQHRLRGTMLPKVAAGIVIALDEDWSSVAECERDASPAGARLRPDRSGLCDLHFGLHRQPKGAMDEHRAMVNLLAVDAERIQLDERDRVLQLTP